MCCCGTEYNLKEVDGECPECGELTVDGDAYESCAYSPTECDECGWAPCDGSC